MYKEDNTYKYGNMSSVLIWEERKVSKEKITWEGGVRKRSFREVASRKGTYIENISKSDL